MNHMSPRGWRRFPSGVLEAAVALSISENRTRLQIRASPSNASWGASQGMAAEKLGEAPVGRGVKL